MRLWRYSRTGLGSKKLRTMKQTRKTRSAKRIRIASTTNNQILSTWLLCVHPSCLSLSLFLFTSPSPLNAPKVQIKESTHFLVVSVGLTSVNSAFLLFTPEKEKNTFAKLELVSVASNQRCASLRKCRGVSRSPCSSSPHCGRVFLETVELVSQLPFAKSADLRGMCAAPPLNSLFGRSGD